MKAAKFHNLTKLATGSWSPRASRRFGFATHSAQFELWQFVIPLSFVRLSFVIRGFPGAS
jgi:hypothetical protein